MKIALHIIKAWTNTVRKHRITQQSWNENDHKTWHCAKLAQEVGNKKTEIIITMQSVALSQKAAGKIDCQALHILFAIWDWSFRPGSIKWWGRIFPSEHQFRPRTFTECAITGGVPGTDLFSNNIERTGQRKFKTVKYLPLVCLYYVITVICSVFCIFGGIR